MAPSPTDFPDRPSGKSWFAAVSCGLDDGKEGCGLRGTVPDCFGRACLTLWTSVSRLAIRWYQEEVIAANCSKEGLLMLMLMLMSVLMSMLHPSRDWLQPNPEKGEWEGERTGGVSTSSFFVYGRGVRSTSEQRERGHPSKPRRHRKRDCYTANDCVCKVRIRSRAIVSPPPLTGLGGRSISSPAAYDYDNLFCVSTIAVG